MSWYGAANTVASERTDRPLIRHTLSCEITLSGPSEDATDETLDAIVTAVRERLSAAEAEDDPIHPTGPLDGASRAARRSVERERG